MLPRLTARRLALVSPLILAGCKGSAGTHPDASFGDGSSHRDGETGNRDVNDSLDGSNLPDVNRGDTPPPPKTDFCKLPGSYVWSGGMPTVVPGGPPGKDADLSWLKVPDGYCAHLFGTVPEARQLRFSPSGDLFVSSPSQTAAGGASGGVGGIVVLPDDNHDGIADKTDTYLSGLPVTQGMLFYNGSFYYQDGTLIRKTPYKGGDRAGKPGAQVLDVTVQQSSLHFQKVLDADDHGNIYVTNGGDNGDACEGPGADPAQVTSSRPFHGGILQLDGTPNGKLVARGLRNAISLRCAKGTGTCFGIELALDFSADLGSREKLFPIRQGDDWGFPCCATANFPYGDGGAGYDNPVPDCSGVAPESVSFVIDHTPFDLDFEEGFWSGTWRYRAFVVLHGIFGSWVGARVVGVATDPRTGWPVPSAEGTDAADKVKDFATGWDDGMMAHGRPSNIAFAPDGRMFIANDMNGIIVWIAPVTAGP